MRVCILRLSALGDATHVLPLIHALRSQRPDYAITWILGPGERKLMEGLKDVELISYQKKDGLAGMLALRRRFIDQPFDVLLHMQLALRANVLGRLIPAKRRIGFDAARSKEGHSLVINERIKPCGKPHVLDAFLDFLPALGLVKPEVLQWPLVIPDSALAFADQHLPRGLKYLLVSPCSSHRLRNWSAERYAAVIDYAVTQLQLTPLLIGGRSTLEADMAAAICQKSQSAIINLTGKDTLKDLLALLQRAHVVLSPDSGPAHMANALGVPVVGLYAATDPRRSGPYHAQAFCTDHYADAALRYLDKAPAQLRWGQKVERPGVMELISVNEVCELLRLANHAGNLRSP
jgi:heptosyltransferase I